MRGTLLILILCFLPTAFSQSDSTDLTLTMSDPVLASADDSLMFPAELYGELTLEFDISDTADFGSVHVDLSITGYHSILYHKSFTETQLNSLGLLTGSSVNLSFGNHELGLPYRTSVVIENLDGTLNYEIHKTLNP